MPVFAVQYTYAPRSGDLDAVRPRHRAFLADLLAAGSLLASGPFDLAEGRSEPPSGDAGALLLVRADDAAAALALLDPDPFHQAGLITRRNARGWVPVLGPFEP